MVHEKTNPLLLSALSLMTEYSLATGANFSIHDHNYMPIPEYADDMFAEESVCLFCVRRQKDTEAKHFPARNSGGLFANPCKEIHINAIKESHRFGGSCTYTCPLGFMFWTSSIYIKDRFIGAIFAGGFLGTDRKKICARMYKLCGGKLSKTELLKLVGRFPRGGEQKIKALEELLLICAQSLSVGSESGFEAAKRRSRQQAELSARIEELKTRYPPGSPPPEYPLDTERKLLAALGRGDTALGKQTLNEILAVLFYANPGQFSHIRYRAVELAVLLSRSGIRQGFTAKTMLENNRRNLSLIEETKNIEELTDTLHMILEDLAGQIHNLRGTQHSLSLKKAEEYIRENFTRKISLKEIAKASGFSAPYFSTIFKAETGENLSKYLKRLRVEKAAAMLTNTDLSLSKIALACGFEDQSWFSKIFKLHTGKSPGKFRSLGGKLAPKIPETDFSSDYPGNTAGDGKD